MFSIAWSWLAPDRSHQKRGEPLHETQGELFSYLRSPAFSKVGLHSLRCLVLEGSLAGDSKLDSIIEVASSLAPASPERPGSGFAVAYPVCTLFAIPRRDRAVHHSPCW